MKKLFKIAVGFLFCSSAFAVNCPDLALIQNASSSLDAAQTRPAFLVYSSHPAVNYDMHDWFLAVYVKAADKEAAITAGQELVKNVSKSINKAAIQYKSLYLCAYSGPNNSLVSAISADLPNISIPADFHKILG